MHECTFKKYFFKPTVSPEDWRNVLRFEEKWNFSHTIGAIDEKHIPIECPKNSGTLYYNYKSFYKILLLATCNVNYRFTLYDLGGYGSNNISGIL